MRLALFARGAAAVVAACTVVSLVPAQASSAGVLGGVTCTGGITTTTYNPGIRFAPRQVSVDVDGRLGVCLSDDPGVGRGRYREHTRTRLGCLDLLNQGAGTRRFIWADGTSSIFSFRRTVTNADGQMVNTFTGTITRGKFRGRSATQVVVVNGALLGCASKKGVVSSTGVGTLHIA